MKLKFLYILLFIIYVSCTKEVKFTQKELEPEIVVNSIMYPNQFLKVSLQKTANILDLKPEKVDNAIVELWNETSLLEKLTLDSVGFYSTKIYKTQENINYTLKIKVPDFDEITATDYIPEKIEFEVTRFEPSNYPVENGNKKFLLDFTVFFSSTNNEFFQFLSPFSYFYKEEYSYSSKKKRESISNFISSNLLILNSYCDCCRFIFNDNQQLAESVNFDMFIFKNVEYPNDTTYNNLIVINSLSENLYNYKKSLMIYYQNRMLESVNDGVPLFSNIKNGIGIFAGCNLSIDTLIWNGVIYNH